MDPNSLPVVYVHAAVKNMDGHRVKDWGAAFRATESPSIIHVQALESFCGCNFCTTSYTLHLNKYSVFGGSLEVQEFFPSW